MDVAEQKKIVLRRMGDGFSVTGAAYKAGTNKTQVYRWRDRDPDFAAKFAGVMETHKDLLRIRAFELLHSDDDKIALGAMNTLSRGHNLLNLEEAANLLAVTNAVPGETTLKLELPELHKGQLAVKDAPTRFMMLRAGRRYGKTLFAAAVAAEMLRDGQRMLYVAPQKDQTSEFWRYVKMFVPSGARITDNPRRAWTESGGEIKALSSWNGDGIRGSFADLVILDEAQLQSPSVVEEVVMPMLLDTDGRLWLTFTPPSLDSLSSARSEDKTWINRYWKERENHPDWTVVSAPTSDNPIMTERKIEALRANMSELRFRIEVLAEPIDDVPGALWRREDIRYCMHVGRHDRSELLQVVIGVDPAGGRGHTGIVVVGSDVDHNLFVLDDYSVSSESNSPDEWASAISHAYHFWGADYVVVERNYGGDMAYHTLQMADSSMQIVETTSSRNKYVRAEPIALYYERERAFHCQQFPELETQMTSFLPNSPNSPDRMDALVFAANELIVDGEVDMDEVYRLLEAE